MKLRNSIKKKKKESKQQENAETFFSNYLLQLAILNTNGLNQDEEYKKRVQIGKQQLLNKLQTGRDDLFLLENQGKISDNNSENFQSNKTLDKPFLVHLR